MLVDHAKALQDAITNFYPDVVYKKRKAQTYDQTVMNAGYRDGGDIQIHSGLTNKEKIQISNQ